VEGGDFATSRAGQRREGPRSLDQEQLLCAWLFQTRRLWLEADPCGISAKEKKNVNIDYYHFSYHLLI